MDASESKARGTEVKGNERLFDRAVCIVRGVCVYVCMVRGAGRPPPPPPSDHLVIDQPVPGLRRTHVKRKAHQLLGLRWRALCQTQSSLVSLLLLQRYLLSVHEDVP